MWSLWRTVELTHPQLVRTQFHLRHIDIKNAFNSIRRSFVLQDVSCPELIPFFSTVYGQAVNLRWNNGSIIGTAPTGVIQGDPLSTLYFAIATQPLLLDIQAKLSMIETHDSQLPEYASPGIVFAIADDIAIHARTPHLYQLSSDMQELPLNVTSFHSTSRSHGSLDHRFIYTPRLLKLRATICMMEGESLGYRSVN